MHSVLTLLKNVPKNVPVPPVQNLGSEKNLTHRMKRSSTSISTPSKKTKTVVKRSVPSYGVPRNLFSYSTGFPKQLNIKHKFSSTGVINYSTGTTVASIPYAANGLFDPMLALGTDQPMYFDECAALYGTYVVTSAFIVCDFLPVLGSQPSVCGIYVTDPTAIAPPELKSTLELPGTKFALVGSNGNSVRVTQTWSSKSYAGSAPRSDSELRGSPTTNPETTPLFRVFTRPNVPNQANIMNVNIMIYYTTTWSERLVNSGSS